MQFRAGGVSKCCFGQEQGRRGNRDGRHSGPSQGGPAGPEGREARKDETEGNDFVLV